MDSHLQHNAGAHSLLGAQEAIIGIEQKAGELEVLQTVIKFRAEYLAQLTTHMSFVLSASVASVQKFLPVLEGVSKAKTDPLESDYARALTAAYVVTQLCAMSFALYVITIASTSTARALYQRVASTSTLPACPLLYKRGPLEQPPLLSCTDP